MGIYNDDGSGRPGSLLLDAGTVAGTATGFLSITINQALAAGIYWLALLGQGNSGTPFYQASYSTIPVPVASADVAANKIIGFCDNGGRGTLGTALMDPYVVTFVQSGTAGAPRIWLGRS
jgi:hypothetical protein